MNYWTWKERVFALSVYAAAATFTFATAYGLVKLVLWVKG